MLSSMIISLGRIGSRGDSVQRLGQVIDVAGFEHERREYAHDLGVAAGAGQYVVVEQRVADLDRRSVADESQQQAHALDFADGPDRTLLTYLRFALPARWRAGFRTRWTR